MKSLSKTFLRIVGGLVFLCGAVWFPQGTYILPGSFMTADPQWAVNGAIAMILGGGWSMAIPRQRSFTDEA